MKQVLHKRSNETQGGGAKLPSAANLEYGEIAVNYHDGVEKLFIKNDDGEVKTFRADNQLPPVEKHENQEFVYRQAVNANEAKSLELTKIYGKTLAWNQQLWDVTSSDLAIISLGGGYTSGVINKKFPKGKYLLLANFVKPNADSTGLYIADETHINTLWIDVQHDSGPIQWVFSADYDFYLCCRFQGGPSNEQNVVFWTTCMLNKQLINLSTLYGSEISGMTDAQILAKFESEFPGYHDYSAGKLISNDAAAVKTVGFNLWDEEWELGYLNNSGVLYNATYYLTSRNFIPVKPNTNYFFSAQKGVTSNNGILICFYGDKDATTIIGSRNAYNVGAVTKLSFTTPSGARYMKFSYGDWGDAAVITENSYDICVNLYDTNKNGTYEPYRESTMPLNLGSFQVCDSQGNVTTVTGGLKSAGSVKDEIVGNKYIQRVRRERFGNMTGYAESDYFVFAFSSSVPQGKEYSNPNIKCDKYVTGQNADKTIYMRYAGNGAVVKDYTYSTYDAIAAAIANNYFDYELATPIEYTLVSPLVPVVKAGTTEERISPNSDGLSAPMVCDMRYTMDNDYVVGEFNSKLGDIQTILQTI